MGIKVEHQGAVGVVTLDWPERRNALRLEDMDALRITIGEVSLGARAIVLTGNGAFCAGADLRHVDERRQLAPEHRRSDMRTSVQGLVWGLLGTPVPTIAAIDGPAVGLGFDLALACDQRIVGPDGWGMQGWGRVGVIPATGGDLLLRRLVPTLPWQLLADQPRLGPSELAALGLAEVVGGTALEGAVERASRLAGLPEATASAYVHLARSELRASLPAHLDLCAAAQPMLLASASVGERIGGILGRDDRPT